MHLPRYLTDRFWLLLRDPIIDFFSDEALTRSASIAFYTVISFAPVLPDRAIAWRDVAIGAIVTSVLFAAAKYLISLYLSRNTVASAYGPAGSLLVVLLWIYDSAQIFLLGAEFTRVCAVRRRGGQPPPRVDPSEIV